MNTRSCDAEFPLDVASSAWSQCEPLIKQFEDAWLRGENPSIADYLLPGVDFHRLLLVELVHVDLEFRIKGGKGAAIEKYLAAFPELGEATGALADLIAAEIKLRRRFEGEVDLDEYARRFPLVDRAALSRRAVGAADTRPASRSSAAVPRGEWPEVPGYEIVGELGHGGMGVVYQAYEPTLDRHVALKFLPAEYAHGGDRWQRFLHEARTASALNHPYICTVHALGDHGGRPFIVMEFVAGRTLRSIARSRPAIADVVRWIRQSSRALAAAHAAGVVHRDIKPENVMVRDDGFVKVLDFGLARRLPSFVSASELPETNPGAMLGTIAYMSPEQSRGEPVASASDIFSLGIVAYELLTALHPFDAATPVSMLHAIGTVEPSAPDRVNAEAPAPLSDLVMAMLHKDAALRPTASEVAAALDVLELGAAAPQAATARRAIVRREAELVALHRALADAEGGRGSLVCVVGEPGIGKTTLVEEFLAELRGSSLLLARGNCSERLADSEAYLPVFDALESLIRADRDGLAARLLRAIAPTWHAQISPRTADAEGPDAAGRSLAASQPAMLREFCGFLQEAARRGPVVLFLDDVHWADVSTVDLLAHVGRNCAAMRVLVIVTYRPTEMLVGRHPFLGVKLDLQARGIGSEVWLDFLGCRDVARYLDLSFPGHAFPPDFAELIHARTEGSPLFMADLLRYLCESGTLAESDGQWRVARELPDLSRELPGSIRGMIQRKLGRLDENDRQVLLAASVQGHAFDSLIVADALGKPPAEVEDRLQALDRVHGLVRMLHDHELPDRSLSLRYAFVHILYQEALYWELLPTRRAWLSLSAARALAQRHGDATAAVTAELAYLFEAGRDFMESARQFHLASLNAARVFAHGEAIALARRGLQLLDEQPPSAGRRALELRLETTLGMQLQMTEGYAAAAAQEAYQRARALCDESSTGADLFPVLWGLWLFYKVRSQLATARQMAEELSLLARRLADPDLSLQAHQALGMTAFCRGEPETSLQHVEQGIALYDPRLHDSHAFQFGQDPGVICKGFGAVVLWLLGYPDAAARQCEATIPMSESLSPSSQAVARFFAAIVYRLRREGDRSRQHARRCGEVAAEHGLSFWMAGSAVLGGDLTDESADECATISRGLVDWQATGSVTYRTFFLGLLAEQLLARGETDRAVATLDEALALVETTGERFYAAELHRLRGEAQWLRSADGEADFREAVRIAKEQNATSLALRAAISLVRHARQPDEAAEARQTLAEIHSRFTEGRDTPDLRDARELLIPKN